MNAQIRAQVSTLAARFAEDIVEIISSSISAHLQPTQGPSSRHRKGGPVPGRRVRRSPSQLAEVADRIVAELGRHRGGRRAEELRATLKLARSVIARPLALLLAERRIRKTGHKRSTTYFAASNGHAVASKEQGAKARHTRARKATGGRNVNDHTGETTAD